MVSRSQLLFLLVLPAAALGAAFFLLGMEAGPEVPLQSFADPSVGADFGPRADDGIDRRGEHGIRPAGELLAPAGGEGLPDTPEQMILRPFGEEAAKDRQPRIPSEQDGPRPPRKPGFRRSPKSQVVIRDSNGRPLPGARVRVRERSDAQIGLFQRRIGGPAGEFVLSSGTGGAIELPQRDGYVYELVIEAEGHATKVVPASARLSPVVELVLPVRVGGLVTNANGNPLAGVLVTAHQGGKQTLLETDAHGHYLFTKLGPGAVWMTVTHPDHLPATAYLSDLKPGTSREQNFSLAPGLFLRGTVKTLAGPLAPGTPVKLIDPVKQIVNATAVTADDGSFSFQAVERGREYIVVAEAPEHAPMAMSTEIPQVGSWDPILLVVQPAIHHQAMVTDLLGKPILGARVLVSCVMAGQVLFQAELETSADGVVTLPGMDSRATLSFHVVADGYSTAYRSLGGEDSSEVGELLHVRLNGEASFGGLVLDETTGEPVPDVALRLRPVDDAGIAIAESQIITMSDHGGRFDLTGLPAGRIEVVTIRAGYDSLRTTISLQAGEHREQDLRLAPLNSEGQ